MSPEEQDLDDNVANWELKFDKEDLVLDSKAEEFIKGLGAIFLDRIGPCKKLHDKSV
jgi:hypothetical protein